MKISVDNVDLFELSDIQKDVIKNDINEDVFDEDMKRRLQYALMHKYERCFERLKSEWDKELKVNGVKTIPLDADQYAQLVFKQPNYMSKKARESAQ